MKKLLLLCALCMHVSLLAQDVSISLSEVNVATHKNTYIYLELSIAKSGYIYANPKGPGIGKAIQVSLLTHSQPIKTKLYSSPAKKYQPLEGDFVNIYKTNAAFYIEVPAQFKDNSLPITIKVDSLFCNDNNCTPAIVQETITVKASAESINEIFSIPKDFTASTTYNEESPQAIKTSTIPLIETPIYLKTSSISSLIGAIITALLAGILLNVMPCVLPVLSLKLMHLVKSSGKSRTQIAIDGLLYTGGVLITFLLLATLSAFAGKGWGTLFQSRTFLIVMTVIIFSLTLSMLGVFTLSVPPLFSRLTTSKNLKTGIWAPLFSGVIATILATPCSGPFLGATLTWTLTQPIIVIYSVFLSIGVGLALPYLIISFFPGLINRLPKGGVWSEYSERIFGFLLGASVIYFLSILDKESMIQTLIILWFAAAGLWQLGVFAAPIRTVKSRYLSYLILVLLIGSGVLFSSSLYTHDPLTKIEEIEYTHSELIHELYENRIVIVKFTADWCPNCRLVEYSAVNQKEVKELIDTNNITFMSADRTNAGTEAEELQNAIGSHSIPFLAIFYPGAGEKNPICLEDIYTKDDLVTAIQQAIAKRSVKSHTETNETEKPLIDLTL